MYMDKVKNFCDHSIILREMAANRKPTGHFWTTPASFRVKGTKSRAELIRYVYSIQQKDIQSDHKSVRDHEAL